MSLPTIKTYLKADKSAIWTDSVTTGEDEVTLALFFVLPAHILF